MLSNYPSVKNVYIDMDDTPELCGQYSVFIAPTILLFTIGKESLRESKFIVLNELESKISRYCKLIL